jgi:hypothetical protein
MIVRDTGDAWQIVLQPDHADLCEQFCRDWGSDELTAPAPLEPLAISSRRHDDGWAVWERSPSLEADTGKPRGFLDVQVPLHLEFYRSCIAAVTDEDSYAGLLVSMHGAGIYRGRYDSQPALKLTHADDVRELVDAFVAEQESGFPDRISGLALAEEERWINYRFLQVFDRLSLYFCMKDLDRGESDVLEPVPSDYAGSETAIEIDPLDPWSVSMKPYPFAGSQATFTLDRRLIDKREWPSNLAFRDEFFNTPVETTTITVVPG